MIRPTARQRAARPSNSKVPDVVNVPHPISHARWSIWPVLVAAACCVRCQGPGRTPPPAYSTSPWADGGFAGRHLATEHFDVYSSLTDLELESPVPAFLEEAYRQYQAVAPLASGAQPRLTVYLFGTRQEWARFTRRRHPADYDVYSRIRVGGYTVGDTSVLFFADRSRTFSTLAHEGWHAYVAAGFPEPMPAWLNEGLACCFEACDYSGDKPRFTQRRNTFRINRLCEAVQADDLIPLNELVGTNAARMLIEGEDKATRHYYPQAWALVTLLRYESGGPAARAFDGLLRDLAAGTFHTAVQAARLCLPDPSRVTEAEATFIAYFDRRPEDFAADYYRHLVKLCRF